MAIRPDTGGKVWRNDREYRKNREALKRAVVRLGLQCHLCQGARGPIDVTTSREPLSFEADHAVPVSVAIARGVHWRRALRGELLPSHRVCNQSRQAKMPKNEDGLVGDSEISF